MTSNLCMAIQGNLVLFNHYWTLQRHIDILSPIRFSPHLHPRFYVHLLWTLEMAPLHKNINMLQMFHLTTPTGLALLSELFPLFFSSPMEGHIVLEHRWSRYEDFWKLRGTNKLIKKYQNTCGLGFRRCCWTCPSISLWNSIAVSNRTKPFNTEEASGFNAD